MAGFLSGSSPEQNVALIQSEFGLYDARQPADLAAHLNALVLGEMQTETYFTLAYADIDLVTGRATLVQAGHPHPAVMHADGQVDYLGAGGLPIGLIEGAEFEEFEVQLQPGDRLFLMSDGIIEAEDAAARQLGEQGLARMLQRNAALPGPALLETLVWELSDFTLGVFPDDVSGALFDFGRGKRFEA